MRRLFLNDKFVMAIILINAICIFVQESGVTHPSLTMLDFWCTIFFIIEMVVKHQEYGIHG